MNNQSTPATADTHWFTEARFGLFIHWGLYALPARHEWVKNREKIPDANYQCYFEHFNPDLYDPTAWAELAAEAGMRYAVITTKHHEGFCLWDSEYTDYKAPLTPANRDLLQPFVEAFRNAGFRLGFYHSLIDWHHPEFPVDGLHPQRDDLGFQETARNRDIRKYREYLHSQVKELYTNFGKIDIAWFDFSYSQMDWGWSRGKGKDDWDSDTLAQMVRDLQPGILLNDRLEIGGDFVTPEQYQPQSSMRIDGKPVLWEACQTLNGSWGYDRDNLDWKPVEMLVKMLIDTVSKGGNLLLNVGPNARGKIEPEAVKRLRGIGKWMRSHHRSIYGCTASSFTPPPDCRYTQNLDRLYLHVFSWPYRHLHLPDLADLATYAQFLHDGSEIPMIQLDPHQSAQNTLMTGSPGTLTLEIPVQKPAVEVPVIEIFLKRN